MTRMNRRDCLFGLGAVAGTLASAPRLNLFAQGHGMKSPKREGDKSSKAIKLALRPPLLRWPITNTPPVLDSFVTVIFGGLMGFSYTTHQHVPACEVGFHSGGANHKRDFKVYKIQRGVCSEFKVLPTNKNMTLRISRETRRGPDFYQSTSSFFDRLKGDPHDFRWLPDLHGGDFYTEGYSLNNHFNKRLYVHDGTFYTRVVSNSTFKLVDKDHQNQEIRGYGRVAMYMAAGIRPLPGDSVLLEVDGDPTIPLQQATGVTYQIVLTNECRVGAGHCTFDVNANDEEDRNDFHFNRKVVKVPNGRTNYAMMIDEKAAVGPQLTFCPELKTRANDESPCMGAGFGLAGGLP